MTHTEGTRFYNDRPLLIKTLRDFALSRGITLYLFGSYARGTQKPASDIDIYIEIDSDDIGYTLDLATDLKILLAPRSEIGLDIIFSNLISAEDGDFIKQKGLLV